MRDCTHTLDRPTLDAAVAGSASTFAPDRRARASTPVIPASLPIPRRSSFTTWLACAGALAYNSWPLAFLVNPTLAGSGLASSFEGHSQPFSWLFILLDCIAGLCMGLVCVREMRTRQGRLRPPGVLVIALLGYGAFGLATVVDAVVPLNCGSKSAQACASQIWPLTPDDLLTGIALLGLFTAACAVIFQMIRRPGAFRPSMLIAVIITLFAWSGLGLAVLAWIASPATTATFQYAFLTLTSILAFIVPVGSADFAWR